MDEGTAAQAYDVAITVPGSDALEGPPRISYVTVATRYAKAVLKEASNLESQERSGLGGPGTAFQRLASRRDAVVVRRCAGLNTLMGANMYVEVLLDGQSVLIERSVFVSLLENSVANGRAAFLHALEDGSIKFSKLVELARTAEIPFSLFFAPKPAVDAQLALKMEKLLQGLTKLEFSLNSRNSVELRDIELIVKDLLRKQELLKTHDKTLKRNTIVGSLRKPGPTVAADAAKLMGLLGITKLTLRGVKTKEIVTQRVIAALEAKQILVAQSQNNYMPQLLRGLKFSGLTIKDAKVPYIFLAGGDEGEHLEPAGRRTFTLVLLAVLIARGVFAPVTYDSKSPVPADNREFAIAAEILMPAADFTNEDVSTASAIRIAADHYKVTPSAIVVRALRLGMMTTEIATAHLRRLEVEFDSRTPNEPRPPKPVNAIRRYNGREFSVRMLHAHDAGQISAGEFCRSVCLNKLNPAQIPDFRAAL